jgi:3-deoxy-manno-octulosonate cytidylyltransferase (CMP-KDO synthetase)
LAKQKIVGIIPVRYGSTRLPGKPLLQIDGRSMIMRVYLQAKKAKLLEDVIVATDDQRIYNEVRSHGGKVVMTSSTHINGTERCAEAAEGIKSDYIINIQGDEPFINPKQIDKLAASLDGSVELATLIKRIKGSHLINNPSIVKVVKNRRNEAMYFSRSPIPFQKESTQPYYKHIGIYAYRKDILNEIVSLAPSPLELAESLEQLRWLENGYHIQVTETDHESQSIDTPEDLELLNLPTS